MTTQPKALWLFQRRWATYGKVEMLTIKDVIKDMIYFSNNDSGVGQLETLTYELEHLREKTMILFGFLFEDSVSDERLLELLASQGYQLVDNHFTT